MNNLLFRHFIKHAMSYLEDETKPSDYYDTRLSVMSKMASRYRKVMGTGKTSDTKHKSQTRKKIFKRSSTVYGRSTTK